ncbi:hypothetical protein NN561_015757 [Cricetulus griseus]
MHRPAPIRGRCCSAAPPGEQATGRSSGGHVRPAGVGSRARSRTGSLADRGGGSGFHASLETKGSSREEVPGSGVNQVVSPCGATRALRHLGLPSVTRHRPLL